MDDCPDCGKNHEADMLDQFQQIEEGPGGGMMVPMHVYGGGLSDTERKQLERILEAIERSQLVTMEMARAGKSIHEEWEGLYRVCTGLSESSILPIMKMMSDGANPAQAVQAVIAGLGATMFIAGTYYQKTMDTPEADRRPIQPMREKLPDNAMTEAETAALKTLLEALNSNNDEQNN